MEGVWSSLRYLGGSRPERKTYNQAGRRRNERTNNELSFSIPF